MRDPIERLRGLDGTGTEQPHLPASEVRRLGDRRRRRTRAALAASTMAAVAAIAVPTAVLTGGADRSAPVDPATRTPAPSPTSSATQEPTPTETAGAADWLTEIPEDFPLDHDLSSPEGEPVEGPSATAGGVERLEICGGSDHLAGDVVDRLAARATGPEYLDARQLMLYADAEAAAAALEEIGRAAEACGTDDGVVWTVHPDDGVGEESLTLSRTLEFGLGTDLYQLTRVGNALLAVDRGGEWDLESTVPDGLEEIATLSAELAGQMCIFTAIGCDPDGAPEETGEPPAAAVLDDTHLTTADRLPEWDAGTWEQTEPQPVPTLICQGDWLGTLDGTEMVSREFVVPAEQIDAARVNTAVVRFADAESADSAYQTLLGWLSDCPAARDEAEPTVDEPVAPPAGAGDLLGPDGAPVERAHQVQVSYLPPGFCPEGCDATWFDHQTIVQVEDRIALVTHAEAAGPCPPVDACPPTGQADYTDWHQRVEATVRAAAGAAFRDLH